MYPISDQQIAYVLNDIRERGIKIESLQESLLDHVCIIIEQNLEEGGDFEAYYTAVIKDFYELELREIEEKTLFLIASKKDYFMKKAMILSGAFSVAAFISGSAFKVMQSRFCTAQLTLGFLTIAFVFLPLLCVIKCRELHERRDKLIWAIGTLVGVLYCISMLELFLHFQHKAMIWRITLAISFFVFIPVYFFTGIRQPEKRINTIAISVLMVAITGIQFSLTALYPMSSKPATSQRPSQQGLRLPGKGQQMPGAGDATRVIPVSYSLSVKHEN